ALRGRGPGLPQAGARHAAVRDPLGALDPRSPPRRRHRRLPPGGGRRHAARDRRARPALAVSPGGYRRVGILREVGYVVGVPTARCMPRGLRMRRDKPGKIIAGRYELLEPAGEGGMAVVWRALTRGAGQFARPVA